MAQTQERIIDIILRGSNRVSPVIRNVSRDARRMNDGFANASKTILQTELALVAIAAVVAKFGDEFDNANRKIQASLGITAEEAEKFGEIAKEIYAKGLVESVEEGADAAIAAIKKFGDTSEEEISRIAQGALKIQKVFGEDYSQSISAAETLTKQFGLTSEQSLDFITAGFQKGLNSSDDFIDSINEYATQFKSGGANASQFFSVLESGLAGGVLGTDKAADAFKEFRVRIQDGSKSTNEALGLLGISSDEFAKKLSDGTITVADAFDIVVKKLGETGDKSTQIQAGVGLLGTQFEDLGTEAALALSLTTTKIDDLAGALDGMPEINQSVTRKMTLAWREFVTSIDDTGLSNVLFDDFKGFLDSLRENFDAALKAVDFTRLYAAIDSAKSRISELFSGLFDGANIETAEGLAIVIQRVADGFATFTEVSTGIISSFQPIFDILGELTNTFGEVDTASAETFGKWGGYALQIKELGLPMAATIIVMKEFGITANSLGKIVFGLADILKGSFNAIKNISIAFSASMVGTFKIMAIEAVNASIIIVDALEKITPDLSGGEELRAWSKELLGVVNELEADLVDSSVVISQAMLEITDNKKAEEGFAKMREGFADIFTDIATHKEKAVGGADAAGSAYKKLAEDTAAAVQKTGELKESTEKLADIQEKSAEVAKKSAEERKKEIFVERDTLESAVAGWKDYIKAVENAVSESKESGKLDLFGAVVSEEKAQEAIQVAKSAINSINTEIQGSNDELGTLYGHVEKKMAGITATMVDGILTFTGKAEGAASELNKAADAASSLADKTGKAADAASSLADKTGKVANKVTRAVNQFEFFHDGLVDVTNELNDALEREGLTLKDLEENVDDYAEAVQGAQEETIELAEAGEEAFEKIAEGSKEVTREFRTVVQPEIARTKAALISFGKALGDVGSGREASENIRKNVLNITELQSGEPLVIEIKTNLDKLIEQVDLVVNKTEAKITGIDAGLHKSITLLDQIGVRYGSASGVFVREYEKLVDLQNRTLGNATKSFDKLSKSVDKMTDVLGEPVNIKTSVDMKGGNMQSKAYARWIMQEVSIDAVANGHELLSMISGNRQ